MNNGVLRNANTVKAGAEGTKSTHQNRAFDCSHDPRNHRTGSQYRTDTGNGEKCGSKQQSPESAPERTGFSPVLHAVACIVIADHLLIGMGVLTDDRQFVHIGPGPLKLFNRFLGFDVGLVDGYYGILFGHLCLLFEWRSS